MSSYDWVGSLAFLPLGFAIAGPLASALGARTVLELGSAITVVLVGVALVPRSTRELGSTEQREAGELPAELSAEHAA